MKINLKSSFFVLVCLTLVSASPAICADKDKGKALFDVNCSSCHGPQGAGDGPVAAALPPESKPRNLQEAKMKFATDDTKFKELLKKGGAALGLNPLMPPQPALSEADMDNVIAFVHTLRK